MIIQELRFGTSVEYFRRDGGAHHRPLSTICLHHRSCIARRCPVQTAYWLAETPLKATPVRKVGTGPMNRG